MEGTVEVTVEGTVKVTKGKRGGAQAELVSTLYWPVGPDSIVSTNKCKFNGHL